MLVITICIIGADLINNVLTPWYGKRLLDGLTLSDRTEQAIQALLTTVTMLIVS